MTSALLAPNPTSSPAALRRWSSSSLALIVVPWLILQFGGIFSPGLLDDVDSVYTEIAREMLQRHDFVTPFVDGIRFFDKPPLMYWMAAGSMHIFGPSDWAARLPLALGVLALLLAVYALGIRLFASVSPPDHPDRAGLYAALAMALSIGPYLYTRFFIPDLLIALWLTLSIHLFLIALDRARTTEPARITGGPLLPMLGFAAVLALDLLTKGLIGIVFPVAFAVLYLAITRELYLLRRLSLIPATLFFLAIAAPWHILAALRNPAISMPSGLGLPASAGWAWFYLYNEHIARFFGRRIPHDYGQVPVPIFWLLLILWLAPWAAFLPSAVKGAVQQLRARLPLRTRLHEASLALLLWAGIVLGFFTISSRQEYYHLPALPALALLVGGLLAAADDFVPRRASTAFAAGAPQRTLRASILFLVPAGSVLFLVCGYFAIAAPAPKPGVTLNQLLSSNPALYNLSLGHMFDLTGTAMGFFRWPLTVVSLCMLLLGPGSHLLRRSATAGNSARSFAANLLIAASMTGVLLAAHEGYIRFNPILGSKDLALAINAAKAPGDLIVIDGELTAGSSLLFYTQQPALLVNGRVNGPWFGSFWPDAPHIFLTDADLARLWTGPHRIFLLTYDPTTRTRELSASAPVTDLQDSGGKTLLSNR